MRLSCSSRTIRSASAAAVSALLFVSAMKKFQEPQLFQPWVPDFLCRIDADAGPARAERSHAHNGGLAVLSREEWVAVAGLLEATAAVGILIPATRRIAAVGAGGMAAAVMAVLAWNQPRVNAGAGWVTGERVRR